MLAEAKFPIIHAGSGILHALAYDELENVANLAHLPVVTSWGARGCNYARINDLSIPMVHVELNDKIRSKAGPSSLTLGFKNRERTDWWG